MSEIETTVRVEPFVNDYTLKMTWAHHVRRNDVREAFERINAKLNTADRPVYVVVDILSNPNFPVGDILTGALFGPFRNPKLKEWLIVGTNPLARIIERMLKTTAKRSNVVWFLDEDEVRAYLEKESTL